MQVRCFHVVQCAVLKHRKYLMKNRRLCSICGSLQELYVRSLGLDEMRVWTALSTHSNFFYYQGHLYLDRLAALPQSRFADLLRVSGRRRDHSFSLHTRKEISRETAQKPCLKTHLHLLYFIPAVFSCVFPKASLGCSFQQCPQEEDQFPAKTKITDQSSLDSLVQKPDEGV